MYVKDLVGHTCTCREEYSSLHTKNKIGKETTLILKIEMLKCVFHNKVF